MQCMGGGKIMYVCLSASGSKDVYGPDEEVSLDPDTTLHDAHGPIVLWQVDIGCGLGWNGMGWADVD